MTNWKKEFATAQLVRRHLSGVDGGKWPVEVPRPAAAVSAIREAEARLGVAVDEDYAAFLQTADGWPGFYQAVDLFGCEELAAGPKCARANEFLDAAAPFRAKTRTFDRNEVVPIAVSADDIDVFCIATGESPPAGRVLWIAGGVIEEFPSFSEFFLSMVDYNRQQIAGFEGRAG